MKIVDRNTFLALPAGTVYTKYAPMFFGPLTIKGDTLVSESESGVGEFYSRELHDAVNAISSDERFKLLLDAENNGTPIALSFDTESRDGMFDADQLFAVWDSKDVKSLINVLQLTIAK